MSQAEGERVSIPNQTNEIDLLKDGLKVGAFVITFKRPDVLRKNLEALLSQTRPPDKILVVDNGASEETACIAHQLAVDYHALHDNLGPAGASEYATKRLAKEGYNWIYWGDEDNPPLHDDIFERLLARAIEAPSDVAGLGEVGARFDWNKGEIYRPPSEELGSGLVEVDYIAGNSQLFLRSEIVEKVGTPNGQLFFGRYEPEYCLRVRRAGYRFLVDGELMYRARERTGRLGDFRTRRLVSTYSPKLLWRRYYRTRNYIYFMHYVFERRDLALRETAKALIRSIFSLARGPSYALKFASLEFKGVLDGYRRRLGRTVTPCPKGE